MIVIGYWFTKARYENGFLDVSAVIFGFVIPLGKKSRKLY